MKPKATRTKTRSRQFRILKQYFNDFVCQLLAPSLIWQWKFLSRFLDNFKKFVFKSFFTFAKKLRVQLSGIFYLELSFVKFRERWTRNLIKWAIPDIFLVYFCLYKHKLQFLQQINVKKCPSSKQCWDSNPRPLEHTSPPLNTRPGLPHKWWLFQTIPKGRFMLSTVKNTQAYFLQSRHALRFDNNLVWYN